MKKNENSFSYLSTSHNSKEMNINGYNENIATKKKQLKKVNFKETITIYDVESYKEHNKMFTYNEQEGLAEYFNTFHTLPFGRKPVYGNEVNDKYFSNCRNPNVTRRNVKSDSCCNII